MQKWIFAKKSQKTNQPGWLPDKASPGFVLKEAFKTEFCDRLKHY
jgi:hypothetical protein